MHINGVEYVLTTANFKFFDYDKTINTIVAQCIDPEIISKYAKNQKSHDIMLVLNNKSATIVVSKPTKKHGVKSLCFDLGLSDKEKTELNTYFKNYVEKC